jgi:hypothetical protein
MDFLIAFSASAGRWSEFQSLLVTQNDERGLPEATMPLPVWSSLPAHGVSD